MVKIIGILEDIDQIRLVFYHHDDYGINPKLQKYLPSMEMPVMQ